MLMRYVVFYSGAVGGSPQGIFYDNPNNDDGVYDNKTEEGAVGGVASRDAFDMSEYYFLIGTIDIH